MPTKSVLLLFFIACAWLTSFDAVTDYHFVIPSKWPRPAYDFSKNPLTAERINLGRALFYDPLLSKDLTISCAHCHSQYTAFAHVDHALSHGIKNQIGHRNAPSLMNLAWQTSFMWDGSIPHLDRQSLSPLTNPIEMNEHMEDVNAKLRLSPVYPTLFYKAYGDSTITEDHTLKAIAQFMLSLVSADAKYDSVMRKESFFTAQEKNGYALFKLHCSSCHTEPLFTNQQFENNGLPVDSVLNDFGRMNITKRIDDSLKFKVPTLRNIEFSYPYMHDGRFKRLSEVLKHYTKGIQQGKTLAKPLQKPIVLSSDEQVDLTAFLLTLTDTHFLFNKDYSYPRDILLHDAKEIK